MGPGNHVLDGVHIPMGRGNFEGDNCKLQGHSAVICAKKAEPIEMPFGFLGLDRPKESFIRWGYRSTMGRGNFGGKGQ